MRILISGAGIAGLALGALCARQGHDVVILDRRRRSDERGYGLALWPHGSRVLHAVGAYDSLVACSAPMQRYTARDGKGRQVMSSPFPAEIRAYGHLGILARGELLGLLERAAEPCDIRYATTLTALQQDDAGVTVPLDDGSTERFDIVVGADGIGSPTRRLLPGEASRFDARWDCLVWWAEPSLSPVGTVMEQWGAGTFLGVYPSADRLCVIAGAPRRRVEEEGPAAAAEVIVRDSGLTEAGWTDGLGDDLTVWPMADVRAEQWVRGRVALLGDAAAAFLPTAGIGASMALEAAAALADELSRADAASAPLALGLYERRRRNRTERAQTLSRRLARLTFVRSRAVAGARDALLRRTSVETLVRPLLRDLEQPI